MSATKTPSFPLPPNTIATQFAVNIKEMTDGNFGVQLVVAIAPVIGVEINLDADNAIAVGEAIKKQGQAAKLKIVQPKAPLIQA